MGRVRGLAFAVLVLLLSLTTVFAKLDDFNTVPTIKHLKISRSSILSTPVDAIDVINIVEKLESIISEVIQDFDEMMSLEPTMESEQVDVSSSEEMFEPTFEPEDESQKLSSTPLASVAPSSASTGIFSDLNIRPRHGGTHTNEAKPSIQVHGDGLAASAEIEEEETSVEETIAEEDEISVADTTNEETSVPETFIEESEEDIITASPTPKIERADSSTTRRPPQDSFKPSTSPSPSASASVSASPRPSPSPKEIPFRTLTYGYKGYTDSVVLLLLDVNETAEQVETLVDQLREQGFSKTKFIAIEPSDIWIRSKSKKERAWFDASDETLGPLREAQVLRATKRVMEVPRGRRPTLIGFGQGGAIALTAYMRYGVDGVVSSCGGLPLISTYPREMTDDSKYSMALVVGGDHLINGVERMQNARREVVFLRTNEPKENGRFKEEVIGYVVGVLNRAIAT